MLRTVKLRPIKISNHAAHLLLYRPEVKEYVSFYIYSLSLNCFNKVLKKINAFSLHFRHKQLSHYSSFTLRDALKSDLGRPIAVQWSTAGHCSKCMHVSI